MASIGKINNAIAQATQETTLALANLNFDFSLIKVEAPLEYQALGQRLSKPRRDNAEDGQIHITARKLGALFRGEIPEVPALIEAYGKRASEIAADPSVNPKGGREHGPFADHIGIDGSTIWATATSGREAITMHLLACMLARMWKPREAISIWVELVHRRKTLLAEKIDPSSMNSLIDEATCKISIDRAHLREWDACARAWIAAADKAKMKQHTQYRIIFENLSLPVSNLSDPYNAVIGAWQQAMFALEQSILGRPQRIQDGAALLGISSWHLYPPLTVIREKLHEIDLHDELIAPSGILTLGLQLKPGDEDRGVFWSLPLTYLRYYNRQPERVERSVTTHSSRVSLGEFDFVCLGSLLAFWSVPDSDLTSFRDLLNLLLECDTPEECPVIHGYQSNARHMCAHCLGLHVFFNALQTLLSTNRRDLERLQRLVGYGRRNCGNLFSITDPDGAVRKPRFSFNEHCVPWSLRRLDLEQQLHATRSWLSCLSSDHVPSRVIIYNIRPSIVTWYEGLPLQRPDGGVFYNSGDVKYKIERWPGDLPDFRRAEALWRTRDARFWSRGSLNNTKDGQIQVWFQHSSLLPQFAISFRNLVSLLATTAMTAEDLLDRLTEWCDDESPKYSAIFVPWCFHSFRIWHLLRSTYAGLHGSVIDLKAASTYNFSHEPSSPLASTGKLVSRADLFHLLALFSYGIDISRADNHEIIAMAAEDSLYVATYLVKPPQHVTTPGIVRLPGSLGKSGLALFITPVLPSVSERRPYSWNLVSHADFEGDFTACFEDTFLHLSLTGYQLPLAVQNQGLHDSDVSLVEAAVSLHGNKGSWLADLEVLLAEELIRHGASPERRTQACRHKAEDSITCLENLHLSTITNWAELLDAPLRAAVLLSGGVHSVRLAAICLCLQLGYAFLVLDHEHTCWQCIATMLLEGNTEAAVESSIRHNTGDTLTDIGSATLVVDKDDQSARHIRVNVPDSRLSTLVNHYLPQTIHTGTIHKSRTRRRAPFKEGVGKILIC